MMNGIEAMHEVTGQPRELSIQSTRNASGAVEVTVQDAGVGLAPVVAEQMFDAFYTTKPEGLGMGLAICRQIVETHGGRLWAQANVPHGATFHFTLSTVPNDSIDRASAENASGTTSIG